MQSNGEDVTRYLERISNGDENAAHELLPIIYDELKRIAEREFRRERVGHTLQPTALVHEAYLKLLADKAGDSKIGRNRNHFFAIAARAIRQILISHARAHGAEKRGGGVQRVPLDPNGVIAPANEETFDTLALHEAIEDLSHLDARHAQIAEMRLFGGLSVAEVAEVMGGSRRLIQLEWKAAKHWLMDRLK